MVCIKCERPLPNQTKICVYCGKEISSSKMDTYFKLILLGCASLSFIFGMLSFWYNTYGINAIIGLSFGLMGVVLYKKHSEPYPLILKISYIFIVFGFMLNFFSLLYCFINRFAELF